MARAKEIAYKPHKTGLAFHNDKSSAKCIAGPPGGGKTVAVLFDFLFCAMRQPADNQMRRRYHLGVIRSTFPKLKTTTKKTIEDWFPEELGKIKETTPMEGLYKMPHPSGDGTTIELMITLLAIDSEDDLEKLKSQEFSGIWLHEGSELEYWVYSMCVQRIGRFPAKKDGVECAEPQIAIDTNTVGTEHWIFKLFRSLDPKDKMLRTVLDEKGNVFSPSVAMFEQPPAMICLNFDDADQGKADPILQVNPDADNLDNLRSDYYLHQANAFKWDEIKAYLLMRWVTVTNGKTVHPDFRRDIHVVGHDLIPNRGKQIIAGYDTSGLHPAMVIGFLEGHTLMAADELYGEGMSQETFITSMLLPLLASNKYAGYEFLAICDPANAKDSRTGVTPMDVLKEHGIHAVSAATNKPELRRQAVSRVFTTQDGCKIFGGCTMLVEALESKYVFRKLSGSSTMGEIYDTRPFKNKWSHVADAFQYLCLEVTRVGKITISAADVSRIKARNKPKRMI